MSATKKGRIEYGFWPMPKLVLLSDEWKALPPNACKLVMALVSQYDGKNNGRLCAAFEALQHYGFNSKHTLIAAKRVLFGCSFAVHTRQGHAPKTSDWVGFTWWKLNWEKTMDVEPHGFPYLNFMKLQPNEKTLRGVQKLHLKAQKTASRGAKTAPIQPEKPAPSVQKLHLSPNEAEFS